MGVAARANSFNQWKRTEGVTIHDCYDQFGRQIGVGDFVILEQHGAVIWRVTNTKPVMRPDAPPGLVELTMAAVTQLVLQGGAPLPGLVKVRDASEYLTPEQLEQYKKEATGGTTDGALPVNTGAVPPSPPPETPPAPEPAGPSRIILP